jgi:PhnB protein
MIGLYLMFNRTCEKALKTYEDAFSTKATMVQKYKDMPPNPNFLIPEGDMDLILHSRIVIDGTEIMCADSSMERDAGDNMFVNVTSEDSELVKKAWSVLSNNGKIIIDLNPTFFAKLHGHLQDEFGINWMFTAQ